MPNDLLMFIVINLIKRNVNIEENALVHGNSRPWLISIRYKISSMIFIVHVTRLHHNNCGIKMLEVGTMNSDYYSLKVLGTPRIDAHLIRKEFLQV